ncbi:MAG: DMP19 family protein, partial [Verrucomicrobiales bacterium]
TMNDPVANAQLELACRLGVLDDIVEALEDGADINCNGNSPIFFAVQAGDPTVVAALLERGADVSCFELDAKADDVLERLMAMVPAKPEPSGSSGGMVELDAKMLRAFHRMISNKGLAEPIKKGRLDEYEAFRKGLGSIAAEDCQALVSEFLELIKPAQDDAEAVAAILDDPANAEKLAELGERYLKAGEDEQPGELLKDYLKERKKIA